MMTAGKCDHGASDELEARPSVPAFPAARVDTGVADLRAALALQTRIAEEFAHRSRNLLTVVGALGRRALREAEDLDAAAAAFDAIIARLADSQKYASHSSGDATGDRVSASHPAGQDRSDPRTPADLHALAREALAGFTTREVVAAPRQCANRPAQILIDGPAMPLEAEAARLLALVFFELASNAVKHGALARPQGRLRLTWHGPSDGGLRLCWRETFLTSGSLRQPAVSDVPARPDRAPGVPALTACRTARASGGGAALFAAVASELGGRIASARRADGYEVEIVLPARHLSSDASASDDSTAAPEMPFVRTRTRFPVRAEARRATPSLRSVRAASETSCQDRFASAPGEPDSDDVQPASNIPKRVLVVEDNPLIGEDLAAIVRSLGVAEVTLAGTASEARACLAPAPDGHDISAPFDLVLLDVTLGDVSADTILPLLASTRVVLVSGRNREDLPEALAQFDLVSKPFEERAIARAIGIVV